MNLFTELKRRSVFRVTAAYLVIGWLVLQVANLFVPMLELSNAINKYIFLLLLLGIIPAIFFSWAFEITPEGIKHERDVIRDESLTSLTAKKLDIITLAAALGVAGIFIWQQFNPEYLVSTQAQSNVQDTDIDSSLHGQDGVDLDKSIDAKSVATNSIADKSIAVLPFVNMSGDVDQEYFSDGITEEILNALANINDLKVVGRTSSFSFKGRNEDIRGIAEKLGVGHILEGSVRKQGQRVRITAQLIQADNGFHIWSESFDDSLEDIFDVQEKISRAIASELQVLLNVGQEQRLAKRLTDNQEAYDLFLQGRELGMIMYGQETLPKAVALLEQAVELDPDFAEAWSWLAFSNFMLPQQVLVKEEKPYIEAAVQAAINSNKLDPTLSAGYSILGSKHFLEKNYLGGFKLIEKAYAIEPNEPMNIFNMGFYRSAIGQTKAALPYLKKSVELDPVGGGWIHNYALTQIAAGNYQAAEQLARRSFDAGFTVAAMAVADALVLQGDLPGALEELNAHYNSFKGFSSHFQQAEVWEMTVQALYVHDTEAEQKVAEYISKFMTTPDFRPDIASVGSFHLVGQPEKFMQAFEQYNFAGTSFLLTRIWDERPGSIALRQHPDFPAFAKRIGLVEVWNKMGWPDKCSPTPVTAESKNAFACD